MNKTVVVGSILGSILINELKSSMTETDSISSNGGITNAWLSFTTALLFADGFEFPVVLFTAGVFTGLLFMSWFALLVLKSELWKLSTPESTALIPDISCMELSFTNSTFFPLYFPVEEL